MKEKQTLFYEVSLLTKKYYKNVEKVHGYSFHYQKPCVQLLNGNGNGNGNVKLCHETVVNRTY